MQAHTQTANVTDGLDTRSGLLLFHLADHDEPLWLESSPIRAAWMVAGGRPFELSVQPVAIRPDEPGVRARVFVWINGVTFLLTPAQAIHQADLLEIELVPNARPQVSPQPLANLLREAGQIARTVDQPVAGAA